MIGDSVGASANVPLENRWFQQVADGSGYAAEDIVNSAVPGDKSAQMLARFSNDVLSHNPVVVVFLMGVNDWTNGVPLATHEANYRSMIEQAQASGAKVVIITPPIYRSNVSAWRQWHEKWLELAVHYGCHLVDVTRAYGWEYAASASGFAALYTNSADLVHQSAAGNARIAAICSEPANRGAFMPVTTIPSNPDCGGCVGPSELQLAAEDMVLNGATPGRLSRLNAALPQ